MTMSVFKPGTTTVAGGGGPSSNVTIIDPLNGSGYVEVAVQGTATVTGTGGTFPVTDSGGSLTVDNAGTFATQESQVITDNGAFTDGTTKVFIGGYIYDETAGTALTENDAAASRIDSKRAQVMVIEDATTRGRRAAVDSSNNFQVTLGTKIAGEDITNDRMKVEHQYSGLYISTATTTTVKSGAGFLHTITIGETAAGAITIYDNTAGSGTVLGVFKSSIAEQTFVLDITFSTGLTIVTAAASKLTVSYR